MTFKTKAKRKSLANLYTIMVLSLNFFRITKENEEKIVYTGEVFSESDIGKTLFLTREEADKVLEEMKKK